MTTLEDEEPQDVIYLHSQGEMVFSGTVVARHDQLRRKTHKLRHRTWMDE